MSIDDPTRAESEVGDVESSTAGPPSASSGSTGEGPPRRVGAARARPTFVVGLGASAGGLEALEKFFDSMPATSGLAFVVVQHLSPDYKSLMVELLSKHTAMSVLRAETGTLVERDTIYLLPPKKNLVIVRGRLELTEKVHGAGVNLPIDIFFRSLAADQAEHAIGIVLSGTGSDGMRGVRAIKEAGGLVVAQDPGTARFDGMPRSAVSTGLVDYVLSPEDMPEQLARYARHLYASAGLRPQPPGVTEDDGLVEIISLLRRHSGVDFTHYKPSTVHRRIERRMGICDVHSLPDYATYVRQTPRELAVLYKELLIGVTKFVRDAEAFESLQRHVLPKLVEEAKLTDTLRVWVPACATGEEAYTIAMLLAECMEEAKRYVDVKIFATDIDRDATEFGGIGIYPDSIAADLSSERLTRFFTRKGDGYQVNRQLRQMVLFANQNLINDPPFTRLDLASCRNVLIYLDGTLQQKVLAGFHFALKPARFLFLGSSETIGDLADCFRPVDSKWKLYQSVEGVRPPVTERMPRALGDSSRSFRDPTRTSPGDAAVIEHCYQTLLEEYAPAALLVTEQHELVHSYGAAASMLRLRPGSASLNVLTLLPKQVASVVSLATHKAVRQGGEVAYSDVPMKSGEDLTTVTIRVRPVTDPRGRRTDLLVVFEREAQKTSGSSAPMASVSLEAEQRLADLQQELQYTKENLQATIEELETSNEELQATNEELLSSNEELQSTNEELQSVNEELHTVNTEYQAKIQELVDLNSDVDNLLRSTSIGTIFLDEQLQIRRFTSSVTELLSLMPRDVGRPIDHISLGSLGDTFLPDLRRVLELGVTAERSIMGRDGRRFLMRTLPYLTEDGQQRGVVVTFVDVTALRRVEEKLQDVLDSLPEHVAVLDRAGTILLVNEGWRRYSIERGADPVSSGPGASYLAACAHVDGLRGPDAAALQRGLLDVLEGRVARFTYDYLGSPSGVPRWFMIVAAPMHGPEGGAIVLHVDVTDRKRAELAAKSGGFPGEGT
jgi:two-component system CheB/CheR fusion protein